MPLGLLALRWVGKKQLILLMETKRIFLKDEKAFGLGGGKRKQPSQEKNMMAAKGWVEGDEY